MSTAISNEGDGGAAKTDGRYAAPFAGRKSRSLAGIRRPRDSGSPWTDSGAF